MSRAESFAVAQQERAHMKKDRRILYCPFEDVDLEWYWDEKELNEFRELWEQGATLLEMTRQLKKNEYDIMFLVADQARLGKIEPRTIGIGIGI